MKTRCQHGQLIDPSLRCEKCEALWERIRAAAKTLRTRESESEVARDLEGTP